MKKLILISFLFLSASQSFGQITLTSSNNPAAGDAYINTNCDTTNITQGNSGENQTWTFLNLIRLDSTTVSFVASSSTPYAAQFPTSDIATTTDQSSYSYLTTSSGNLLFNGVGSQQVVVPYTNPQTLFQYPFTYASTYTDNFASNFNSSGFEVFSTGTITSTGDAWGRINLPNGSFPNALRIKNVVVTNDSSFIGISTSTATSYNWYVAGRKAYIFSITYINFSFNGLPLSSDKIVDYNASGTIGISTISSEIPNGYKLSQNYPNPFNPSTKLRFALPKSGLVKLTVFDAVGREVETLVNSQLQSGTYEVDFNAGNYSGGTYFYRLQSEGFVETKKMILVK